MMKNEWGKANVDLARFKEQGTNYLVISIQKKAVCVKGN